VRRASRFSVSRLTRLGGAEKERFSHYEERLVDMSLSTKILSPFWEAVARVVPSNVAPNVLTLAGLLCTIQAFYLCYSYMAARPSLVTVAAAVLVFAYQTLDALDGIQARRTSNASPVGALWDHACDNVAIVFVSLVSPVFCGSGECTRLSSRLTLPPRWAAT
jgi:hypothetical protein